MCRDSDSDIGNWSHEEVCECDLFLWAKCFSHMKIYCQLIEVCGYGVMGAQHDRKWHREFENGRIDTRDICPGQPSTSRSVVNTAREEELIFEN